MGEISVVPADRLNIGIRLKSGVNLFQTTTTYKAVYHEEKMISGLLVLALCLSSAAFAGQTFTFTDKSGQHGTVIRQKETATGSKGSVRIEANSGKHSMYYQIHKKKGGAASVYKNTTASSGSYSLSYNKDGHGNSLGRKGYEYRLRVAHRRQCACTNCNEHNPAVVTADYTP